MSEKRPFIDQHPPLIQSFRFALEGLWFAVANERNFRIHLVAAVYALFLGGRFYDFSPLEWGALTLTIALVMISELLNTALEKAIDIISPERNPSAKIAKDVAAGAVLISALASMAVGFLLFYQPEILKRIVFNIRSSPVGWVFFFVASPCFIWLPYVIRQQRKRKNLNEHNQKRE